MRILNCPYIIYWHNVHSFSNTISSGSTHICRKFHWHPTMGVMNNRTLGIYSHYHLNLSSFLHILKTRETGCHNGPAWLHISSPTTSEMCGMCLQTVTHITHTCVCPDLKEIPDFKDLSLLNSHLNPKTHKLNNAYCN